MANDVSGGHGNASSIMSTTLRWWSTTSELAVDKHVHVRLPTHLQTMKRHSIARCRTAGPEGAPGRVVLLPKGAWLSDVAGAQKCTYTSAGRCAPCRRLRIIISSDRLRRQESIPQILLEQGSWCWGMTLTNPAQVPEAPCVCARAVPAPMAILRKWLLRVDTYVKLYKHLPHAICLHEHRPGGTHCSAAVGQERRSLRSMTPATSRRTRSTLSGACSRRQLRDKKPHVTASLAVLGALEMHTGHLQTPQQCMQAFCWTCTPAVRVTQAKSLCRAVPWRAFAPGKVWRAP